MSMKKILLILTALTVSAAAFAEKITTVAEITSGNKYYIGATTDDKDSYFYVDGSAKTESIKGVAKEDVADAVALTFTEVTDGWTIQFDNGLYLGLKNAKDNGSVQVMEAPVVWTIEEDTDNGLLKLHPNASYSLQKNTSGTQFGSYNNSKTNVWLESAGATPVLATLDSLVIKGKAEKMEYEVGEAFDPAGLEVWGIYTKTVKHDSISQIKSGITWTLDPETFEEASDNASVTLVASYKDLTTTDTTITSIKVNAVVPAPAPYLMVGKTLTINDLKASGKVNMQYFKYKNDERINGIAGDTPNSTINLFDTEGYCEINYTNKDNVKRNFIVNPKIENAVDSIYQGETYLFADTLLTTAGTYQRTIESNTMTLTLKVKQKPVKYTTYANWQIKYGNGWEWTENMTKVEEGLFKLEILWEGTGFNVKSDDNPIKKDWYAVDGPDVVIGEEVIAPVTVDVYLRVIDDETLKIGIGVEPPVPASGPTVDETGITVNGRKYGFPVRLVKEVK